MNSLTMCAMLVAAVSVVRAESYVLQATSTPDNAEWSADGGVTKVKTADVPAGSTFRVLNSKALQTMTADYTMPGIVELGCVNDEVYGSTTGIVSRAGSGTLTANFKWYYGRIHHTTSKSMMTVGGTIDVINTGKSHWFGSGASANIRLEAALRAEDTTVTVVVGHQYTSNSATFDDINDSCPNGQMCIVGDNSAYKGKFTLASSQVRRMIALGGRNPLGSPDTPVGTALTLNTAMLLAMAADCEQSTNRNIYCTSSSPVYFGAWKDSDYDGFTLSYPITCSTTSNRGRFIKVGDGTFRYNGKFQARDIAISNGTFVVGKDATFPSGQKFIVGSGARLVIEPGALAALDSPAITFVDETATAEYGLLTIPFDGKAATPVEIASRPYAWVQPIALAQPFDLPIRNRKRVLVATIPNGGCTLADFRDESPKSTEDGLPETSLDLVTDGQTGAQLLYIVAEPAMTELTVPFDGTNATAVVIDEDWPVGTVQAFTLSRPFDLPINATNRVAVLKILGGRHPLEDFQDNTPKTVYELPTTWIELGEEAGYQVVYVVVRPALASAGGGRWQSATRDGIPTWSDELVTHMGADYYYIEGYGCVVINQRTNSGTNGGAWTFPGESFTIAGAGHDIDDYNSSVTFRALYAYPGTSINLKPAGTGTTGPLERSIKGACYVGGTTEDWDAPLYVKSQAHITTVGLYADLTGSGSLRYSTSNTMYSDADNPINVKLYGDNARFTGQLHFFEVNSGNGYYEVSVTNALAFGGPLDEFAANAVCISRDAATSAATSDRRMVFRPEVSMTVDTPNRGWRFTSCGGGFRTPKDVVFTFAPPRLTLQRANSVVFTLRKDGEGALVLGFDELEYVAEKTSYKLDTQLLVAEGSVGQSKAGILAKLPVVFAGGGVCVDAAHPVEGGFAPKSVALEEGTSAVIPVSFVNLPSERQAQHFTVMTVPAGSPELTLVPAKCKGYVVTLASETDGSGNTVWTADLEPAGMAVILK